MPFEIDVAAGGKELQRNIKEFDEQVLETFFTFVGGMPLEVAPRIWRNARSSLDGRVSGVVSQALEELRQHEQLAEMGKADLDTIAVCARNISTTLAKINQMFVASLAVASCIRPKNDEGDDTEDDTMGNTIQRSES